MAENQPPSTNPSNPADAAGIPYYNKEREKLQETLRKKKMLEISLARLDEAIYKKETDYFEDTPAGNIITGFDNYTKGVASSIGGRRRTGVPEQNRVFSRSSITYNINAETPVDTAQSTPVAAMAPTPLSTSFLKDGGASNHATPTSATSANKSGGAGKKNIKKARDGDDSETEKEGNKKMRTNFGAVRK